MDQTEKSELLRQRIGVLAALAELTVIQEIQENTCWLDGGKCPYGSPGGKFELRPTQFCHLNVYGCQRLLAHKSEFEDDFGANKKTVEEILKEEVPKLIDENGLELSEVLKDISSDDMGNLSDVEREVLELAADILALGSNSDCKVLTENFDFEDLNL